MRRHPLSPNRTLAVPDPNKPVPPEHRETVSVTGQATVHQPAFEIPMDGEPTTLDALVALSKNGNTVPMPVARDITDKELAAIRSGQAPSSRLTKLERDTLTKLGWQEGEPIPPDLASELQSAFSGYVAQKQAQGIPLDQIRISRLEDLPESEQVRMKAVMRALIEQEKSQQATVAAEASRTEQLAVYPDSVKQVLAGVDLTPSVPLPPPPLPGSDPAGTQLLAFPDSVKQMLAEPPPEPKPVPFAPQEPAPKPLAREIPVSTCHTCGHDPFKEKQRIVCYHCACDPLDDPETAPISLEDKRRFLIALGTKKPFEKEYTIFRDTIKVRFRTLRAREFEEITLWAIKAVAKEKILAPQEMMPRVRYMELLGSLVLQTRLLQCSLEGAELFWGAPDKPYPTLADWEVESFDALVDHFMEEVPAEAVIVALQHQLTKFNELDFRLSREANNTTNFWKGT